MSSERVSANVAVILERGREAYVAGRFDEAMSANEDAHQRANAGNDPRGSARALRFMGLCAYRLGDGERSRELLTRAHEAARRLGWTSESLLVANHLGATLRRLGRLDEADAVFKGALAQATGVEFVIERARLLGNYGAFHDDLGDARAAGEYYARYEELVELVGDQGRLANARGLTSRSAWLRGDFALALAKAHDEVQLGRSTGQPVREARGHGHVARALASLGREDEARAAFERALVMLAERGDAREVARAAVSRGEFELGAGRIHDADVFATRARESIETLGGREHEVRARVEALAARVASAAGLHGEALDRFSECAELMLERFEAINDERLKGYTAARRRELAQVAEGLDRECATVGRTADELERVRALIVRLRHEQSPSHRAESVEEWQRRVREESSARWRRILPESFTKLPPRTTGDLTLVDIISHGAVGDLPGSVLLLFTILEREMQARLRAKPLVDVRGLREVIQHFKKRPDVPKGFSTTLESQRAFPGLAGRSLIDVRNALAHGREIPRTRVALDAVRRALTLGDDAPLRVVLRAPLVVQGQPS